MLNERKGGGGVGSILLLAFALALAFALLGLAWWVGSRDVSSSFLASVASPGAWIALLAALIVGVVIFIAVRTRLAEKIGSPDLGRHMLEVLRSGKLDLFETERLARETVATLPGQIFFRAPDRRHIHSDEAWQKLFGITRSAFVSSVVRDLYRYHTDGSDKARVLPRIIGEGRADQVFRTVIVLANGERLETTHRKAPFVLADGSSAGLIGVIVKMVERKEAELFDMLGFSRADLAGKTIREVPRARDHLGEALARGRMKRGAVISLSTEIMRTDDAGAIRWFEQAVSVVCDRAGKADYLLCSSEDVTERRLGDQRGEMEHAVTRVLAETEHVSDVLSGTVEEICRALGWHCGSFWILDRESGRLTRREGWGFDKPELTRLLDPQEGEGVTGQPTRVQTLALRAFLSARPVWIPDLDDDAALAAAGALSRAGMRGGFGLPLLLGNKVIGALEFYHRGAPEPNEALLRTFQAVGSQIAQYVTRVEAEGALRFAAARDALTGLPNREMFNQRLEHAVVQARRRGTRLAVLFVDLDHFKIINDTLGHDAGDALLREVASRLSVGLRASDTVARLGGDEFVVLVEDIVDPVFVGGLARKLLEALGSTYVISGHECHLSVSIGSSTFPDDCDDGAELLKNADAAMYRAKDQGRNRFHFYSEQMNSHAVERMAVESALRRALDRDELILHYQPKINARSGRVTGLEALLRWKHPEMGLVPPAQFMQVANETGLIAPIGQWVLETACAARKNWERQGMPGHIAVAVNLSRRQFMHGDLVKDMAQVLGDTGCRADAIALEITEGMIMHNPERAIHVITGLKALGLQVVIDDFGTGYSSLASLRRFPIDALKIDRSFVDLEGDPSNAAIARAIVEMAHSLKLNVIAEGVETRQQLDFLREIGCTEIQGFLVSKPLAPADAFAFVEESGGCRSSTA